ncbi:MAG: type II toxin-antitoxin system HicA family toxin [Candidatus Altiarchaeota archaeon]
MKLPVVSGLQAIKAFKKAGWNPIRQAGSHVIMMKEGSDVTLSIPLHKNVKRGTLRALIRDSGLTVSEYVKLLK